MYNKVKRQFSFAYKYAVAYSKVQMEPTRSQMHLLPKEILTYFTREMMLGCSNRVNGYTINHFLIRDVNVNKSRHEKKHAPSIQ